MSKLLVLATAALFVGSASAHTIFQKLYVNGVDQGELTGIRAPDYDGVRPFLPLTFSGPVAHYSLIYSPSPMSLQTTSFAMAASTPTTNLSPRR